MTCPEPGIYRDVPLGEYLTWDAASASRLSDMAVSPARCRWNIDHPGEPTEAMLLGSAVHTAILEADRFRARYAALPGDDRRLKEVKAAAEEIEARGLIPLRARDWELCFRMREECWKDSLAGKLLSLATDYEVSCVADLPLPEGRTVRFKFRPDAIASSIGMVLDLKTAADGSEEAMARSMDSLGYHRQAALYRHGLQSLGQDYDLPALIVVEKDAEIEVDVYEIDETALVMGLTEGLHLLSRYADCMASGQWPKRGGSAKRLRLPPWRMPRQNHAAGDTGEITMGGKALILTD